MSMVVPLILPHAQDIGASPTQTGILGMVRHLESSSVGAHWAGTKAVHVTHS